VRDPAGFRSRAVSPRGGEGYLVQRWTRGKSLDLSEDEDGDDVDDGDVVKLTLTTSSGFVAATARVRLAARGDGVDFARERIDDEEEEEEDEEEEEEDDDEENDDADDDAPAFASAVSAPGDVTPPPSNDSCVAPTFSAWEPWGECCAQDAARGPRCGVYCGEPRASRGRRRDVSDMPPFDDVSAPLPCLLPTTEIDDECAATPCDPPSTPKRCSGVAERLSLSELRSDVSIRSANATNATNATKSKSSTALKKTAAAVGARGVVNAAWEDWSWSTTVETIADAGVLPTASALRVGVNGGGALALRVARLPAAAAAALRDDDASVALVGAFARIRPRQPPPPLDLLLELSDDDLDRPLPRVYGAIVDWDALDGDGGGGDKVKTARDAWNEGCYAGIKITAERLRARDPRADDDETILDPYVGVRLADVVGELGEDVGVKIMVQLRAAWETSFYVGRLALQPEG
jgi:hypothetical protein